MFFKKGWSAVLTIFIVLWAPLTRGQAANAQTSQAAQAVNQTLRSTAEPGRVGEALSEESREAAEQPEPSSISSPFPDSHLSTEDLKLAFTLQKVNLINPIIFSQDILLSPFQQFYGKTITLGEVQKIANCLTDYYHKAGYTLVQVILPPQRIHDGIITLQVVSGYIDKVEISGKVCDEVKALLLSYGEKLRHVNPLKMETIERYTLIANDVPGVSVSTVLKPSKTATAAADLTFVVKPKFENSYISMNNYGTRFLGPIQYMAGVEEASYFRPGDSTQVQVVSTMNYELGFGQLRYTMPVGCEGVRVGGFGRLVRSEPGSILAPFEAKGKNKAAGTEVFFPFERSRKTNTFFQAGFMIIDSSASILGMPLYADRIRPIYLTLIYNRLDDCKGVNHAELTATQGLKIFKASGATNISRPNGKSSFTKLNGLLTRQQPLFKNLSFFTALLAQYSFRSLLSISQFGFGGSEIGRGYDPSEILGDKGVAGTFELRYDRTRTSHIAPQIQYYAFYDWGVVWHTDPTIKQQSATSTGIGARVTLFKNGKATFYIAKPLTRKVLSLNNRHMRAFFSITFSM